jgi:hypothetical protein
MTALFKVVILIPQRGRRISDYFRPLSAEKCSEMFLPLLGST